MLRKSLVKPMYEFHAYAMRDVLKYESFHYVGPSDIGLNGLLWTVLKQDENGYFDIDSQFLESLSVPRTGSRLDADESTNSQATLPSRCYDDTVIMPRHRLNDGTFYYAEGIHKNICVDDAFPNKAIARNYRDYYRTKYGLDLAPGQKMVEAVPVNKYLNLLEFRYQDEQMYCSKRRQKLLLPEDLCIIHHIPAHLWKQIVAIPVILYRLSSIVEVCDLQENLMDELGLERSDEMHGLDNDLSLKLCHIHKDIDSLGLRKAESIINGRHESCSSLTVKGERSSRSAFKEATLIRSSDRETPLSNMQFDCGKFNADSIVLREQSGITFGDSRHEEINFVDRDGKILTNYQSSSCGGILSSRNDSAYHVTNETESLERRSWNGEDQNGV